jgi:Spy/CpxP family protein refolding chaperone
MTMKPWIKRVLIGVFGLSILTGGIAAYSHGHRMSYANMTPEQMAQHRAKAVDRIATKMELTADQKAKLNVLADKLQAQYLALHGTAQPRAQVAALVTGPKFDRSAAQALVTEKTSALQLKSPEVIAALGDFYDSLNPTQQQKVRDFMARHHGRGMMRHGEHGGHGD